MIDLSDTLPQLPTLSNHCQIFLNTNPVTVIQSFDICFQDESLSRSFREIVIIPKTSYSLFSTKEKGTMIKIDKNTCRHLQDFMSVFACDLGLIDKTSLRLRKENISIFSSLSLRHLYYRPEKRNIAGSFNTETVVVCEAKFRFINLKKRIRYQLQLLSEFFPVEIRYIIFEAYLALI